MSILLRSKDSGKNVMLIKGAPDYLLNSSKAVMTKSGKVVPFTNESRQAFDK